MKEPSFEIYFINFNTTYHRKDHYREKILQLLHRILLAQTILIGSSFCFSFATKMYGIQVISIHSATKMELKRKLFYTTQSRLHYEHFCANSLAKRHLVKILPS